MLKLSKIYCNKPDIFPEIEFHEGLNIVYASVTDPKAKSTNYSHSVGKTTLLEVIDYALLKKVDKKFFLNKHKSIFSEYVFFLEVEISSNLYATIRREVGGKIAIHTHSEKKNLTAMNKDDWAHKFLGLDKAKSIFDSMIDLKVVRDLDGSFRKGLRYALRRQNEYSKTFQVRNVPEKASSWKPYLCGLIGIDHKLILKKLNINEKIERLNDLLKELEVVSGVSSQAIEAEIQVATSQLDAMRLQVESFDFRKADQEEIKLLVEMLDDKISEFNGEAYQLEHRIRNINESLNSEFKFDLEQVKSLYDEISLILPEQLVKSYEDLVEMNKALTVDQSRRLKIERERSLSRLSEVRNELASLNAKRADSARQVLDEETFNRYKSLQAKLSKEEARIALLSAKLEKLDSAADIRSQLSDCLVQQQEFSTEIDALTRQSHNEKLKSISNIFSHFVRESTDLGAFFYVNVNSSGNPEFNTALHDHTSQDDGVSYRQIISACFDLSLSYYYSQQGYYRFLYHDGVLESIDDRLKIKVLNLWKDIAIKHGLQLIVTLHDSDIPLDENGNKYTILDSDVIRKLHDRGDDGRLFKMKAF